jgi:cytoskeleton protein RodZ
MGDRSPGDFGRTLRTARERRGLSLRQIANTTKIGLAVLEGLERNDISRLPGGIFGRGIVRSYATEVGLDPEAAIQDFIAQFPRTAVTVGHLASPQAEDHLAVESDRHAATTFVRLVAISVPLAVAVMYFGATGRPGVEPLARSSPGVIAEAAPASNETPAALISSQGSGTGAAATTGSESPDRLVVELSAFRECWLSVTVDGTKIFEGLLSAGEQRTFDTRREAVLTVGDASAIALTLNGSKARPLGADGRVVTLRLNPGNFNEYIATP